MNRFRCLIAVALVAAASGLSAGAASAQETKDSPDVVVKGERLPDRSDVKRQARDITDAAGPRLRDVTLARFAAHICPGAVGLSTPLNLGIVDRIRADALEAGLRVDNPGCKANALVVFVKDGQKAIKALIGAHSDLFAGLSIGERTVLANAAGPVHVWRRVSVGGTGGDTITSDAISPDQLKVWWPSHIFVSTQLALEGAIILIDVAAVEGKSVAQLGDYATMRLLAETRPPQAATGAATILTLFDEGAASRPAEMTDFDRAYLKTVYRAESGRTALESLGSVAHIMEKQTAPH